MPARLVIPIICGHECMLDAVRKSNVVCIRVNTDSIRLCLPLPGSDVCRTPDERDLHGCMTGQTFCHMGHPDYMLVVINTG